MRSLLVACLVASCGFPALPAISDSSVGDSGRDASACSHTPVQQKTVSESGANATIIVTPANETRAGNFLVLVVALQTASSSVGSVDQGFMKAVAGQSNDITPGQELEIWYAPAAAATSSITVTALSSRPAAISFSEWACNVGPVDMSKYDTGGSMAVAGGTGLLTTTAPDLIVGAVTYATTNASAPSSMLTTPSFMALDSVVAFDGNNTHIAVAPAYRFTPDAGSYEVTWSLTPSDWSSAAVGFKLQ